MVKEGVLIDYYLRIFWKSAFPLTEISETGRKELHFLICLHRHNGLYADKEPWVCMEHVEDKAALSVGRLISHEYLWKFYGIMLLSFRWVGWGSVDAAHSTSYWKSECGTKTKLLHEEFLIKQLASYSCHKRERSSAGGLSN